MPNLTLASITGESLVVSVADDTLVYDGWKFVQPQNARYVELHMVPVSAMSLAFGSIAEAMLVAETVNLARVISCDSATGETTNPHLIIASDPSNGMCICMVTCKGTALTYVVVYNQES